MIYRGATLLIGCAKDKEQIDGSKMIDLIIFYKKCMIRSDININVLNYVCLGALTIMIVSNQIKVIIWAYY